MALCNVQDKLICRSCRRVYDHDPFASLLLYDAPDPECRCGGELDYVLECACCGADVPESEAVMDTDTAYCSECRVECAYCYTVIDRADALVSAEGYCCCSECKNEEEAA